MLSTSHAAAVCGVGLICCPGHRSPDCCQSMIKKSANNPQRNYHNQMIQVEAWTENWSFLFEVGAEHGREQLMQVFSGGNTISIAVVFLTLASFSSNSNIQNGCTIIITIPYSVQAVPSNLARYLKQDRFVGREYYRQPADHSIQIKTVKMGTDEMRHDFWSWTRHRNISKPGHFILSSNPPWPTYPQVRIKPNFTFRN